MADIKLKDRNDNKTTYTGVCKLKVPTADGGENVTFQLPPVMQEKAVTITENGTTSIVPDEGKDGLSKVDVTVNVPVTPTQEKAVTITENGTSSVTPDEGKVLSKVDVTVNVPTTPTQEKTASLSMADGDQVVTPDEGKVLTKVTVQKPSTLALENIKKDVNIGGVVGTLESGGGGGSIHILTDDVVSAYMADLHGTDKVVGGFEFSKLTADTLNRAKIIFIGAYNARTYDVYQGVQINNLCHWLVLSNEQLDTSEEGVEVSMLSMAGIGVVKDEDNLPTGRGINGIGYSVDSLQGYPRDILKYQAVSGGVNDRVGAASSISVQAFIKNKTLLGFQDHAKYKAFVVTDFLPLEAT